MACTLPCKYLYMNENIELIVCWLGVPSVTHYTQPYLWIFINHVRLCCCCLFILYYGALHAIYVPIYLWEHKTTKKKL